MKQPLRPIFVEDIVTDHSGIACPVTCDSRLQAGTFTLLHGSFCRVGLAGLQAAAGTQQQAGGNRFPNALQSQLQQVQ